MSEQLWTSWVGNNADKKQIEGLVKEVGSKRKDQKQIQADWGKLQSVVGGLG